MKIYYKGIEIDSLIDKYFLKLSKDVTRNYYRNKIDTKIYLDNYGYYYFNGEIYFNNAWVLVHELMHMASYDKDRDIDGFNDREDNGIGLSEGMTEYLTMNILEEESPSTNFLEVFCTEMLMQIKDYRECYLRAERDKFMALFPGIEILSNELDKYLKIARDEVGNERDVEILVNEILASLIEIAINLLDRDGLVEWKRKFITLYDKYKMRYRLFNDEDIKKYQYTLFRGNNNESIRSI